jgi:hypothetical protein
MEQGARSMEKQQEISDCGLRIANFELRETAMDRMMIHCNGPGTVNPDSCKKA